jgi:hypothetical protein
MKSSIKLACPVSGKTASVPYADDEEGKFVPYEGDDEIDLPRGWGRMVFDVVAPNPEIAEVAETRAKEVRAAMKQIKSASADPKLSEEERAEVKADLDSGKVLQEVEAEAARRLPLPEQETVVLRLAFPVLSDEAVGAAIKALRDAGFPIEAP